MRKPFLDNLRYGIVLSVAVYHVFYQFNSVGVITNVLISGIPALDAPLYVLYPWFMAALFMISGICARYSLEKQTGKQYLKGKVRRQLIPSIAIIFLIGWSTGWVTDQYANIFGGGQVPGFAKYLVWCMSGIGVLWFLHELLLCEVVLVLIRKLDKKDWLWQLGGKANFPVICLLVLGMWGSAYILNTPVIEVYRNGFYLFCFLAGYILFSHEQIQSLLAKWAPCMLAVSGVLAVVYTVHFWGQNYAALNNLKAPLTNLYAWFACLGVLGAGKRWLDQETAFTRYMAGRSFGIYVLHNPLLVLLAWAMDKLLHFPVWSMYLLLPVLLALLLPPLIALIKRIPVLRTLVLGEEEIDYSILAAIGGVLAWVFKPLGWGNWQAAVASITGLVAKENIVGTMGILYPDGWTEIGAAFTQISGYSFLVFNLLCAPCFAAIGAIKREMNNAKWTWFAIGYQCGFAYVVALMINQFGNAFTGSLNVLGLIAAVAALALIVYMLFKPYKEATKLSAKV